MGMRCNSSGCCTRTVVTTCCPWTRLRAHSRNGTRLEPFSLLCTRSLSLPGRMYEARGSFLGHETCQSQSGVTLWKPRYRRSHRILLPQNQFQFYRRSPRIPTQNQVQFYRRSPRILPQNQFQFYLVVIVHLHKVLCCTALWSPSMRCTALWSQATDRTSYLVGPLQNPFGFSRQPRNCLRPRSPMRRCRLLAWRQSFHDPPCILVTSTPKVFRQSTREDSTTTTSA